MCYHESCVIMSCGYLHFQCFYILVFCFNSIPHFSSSNKVLLLDSRSSLKERYVEVLRSHKIVRWLWWDYDIRGEDMIRCATMHQDVNQNCNHWLQDMSNESKPIASQHVLWNALFEPKLGKTLRVFLWRNTYSSNKLTLRLPSSSCIW